MIGDSKHSNSILETLFNLKIQLFLFFTFHHFLPLRQKSLQYISLHYYYSSLSIIQSFFMFA